MTPPRASRRQPKAPFGPQAGEAAPRSPAESPTAAASPLPLSPEPPAAGSPPAAAAPHPVHEPSARRPSRRSRDLDALSLPAALEAFAADAAHGGPGAPPLEIPPPRFFLTPRGRIVAGVLAVFALAALIAGRPAYRELKTWRAHRFVAEAELLMAATNWPAALQKAQVAYQLSPADPQTLRLAARLTSAQGQRDALHFWRQLIDTGQATAEDHRQFGLFALRGRDLESAGEQLRWLLKNDAETFATLRFAVDFYLLRGDLTRLKEYGRLALAKEPNDQPLRLTLARVLARSPDITDQIEARKTIRTTAEGVNAASLEALELLASLRDLPRDDAEATAQRLLEHPLARTEHQLLALELRLRWHPEQREAIVAGGIAKFEKTGAENLLKLARWLNRLGEFERTIACLSPETAMKSQDLLLVRLDAMGGLDRWDAIKQTLEQKDLPLEPALVDLFKARVAKQMGQTQEAAQAWRRVHLAAIDRPAAWLYIAQYAEQIGDRAEAAKAWHRLKQDPTLGRTAFEALIRLGEVEGNTRALRELMRELSKTSPNEPEPRNDLAYLDLLLGENLKAARETSLLLVKDHPNYLAYRTTLALAHLRHQETNEAAALYAGINLDWAGVLPGWQAVRVAVLAASGRSNLARIAAQRIPLPQLKPEERALVQPHL